MSADRNLPAGRFPIRHQSRGYHAARQSLHGGFEQPAQQWGTYHAFDPSGESAGHLDYAQVGSRRDPYREVHVEDLQVHPGHQGKGIASALMDHLQAEHPGPAEITHNLRTPEGARWWEHYAASRGLRKQAGSEAGE